MCAPAKFHWCNIIVPPKAAFAITLAKKKKPIAHANVLNLENCASKKKKQKKKPNVQHAKKRPTKPKRCSYKKPLRKKRQQQTNPKA